MKAAATPPTGLNSANTADIFDGVAVNEFGADFGENPVESLLSLSAIL